MAQNFEEVKRLFSFEKPRSEIVFFFIAILIAFLFLANLNTKEPLSNVYSSVYQPFILMSAVLFVASVALKGKLPVGFIGFGDPSEKIAGIPKPLFSGLIGFGVVAMFAISSSFAWTPFSILSEAGGEETLVKISLGSGLLEEVFNTGVLMPTLALIISFYGLIAGMLVLLFFGFFFGVPLGYVFLLGIVGLFLFALTFKRKNLAVEKNFGVALLAAVVLSAIFFVALHERVNAGDTDRAFSELKFSLISSVLAIATGSLAGSVVMHVANNAVALGSEHWWVTPLIMLGLFTIYSFVQARNGKK